MPLSLSSARRPLALALALFVVLGLETALAQDRQAAYVSDLHEMNPRLTEQEVSGRALFLVEGGRLHISLAVRGVAPGMMHLQHIHGFTDGEQAAACPPAEADANGDGIVDLLETEPYVGVTLVPFNGAPAGLEIESESYPVATEDGLMTYTMSVPLAELEAAAQEAYGLGSLALERRAVFIHGVPEGAELPASVQSLPGVPSHVTVPIACGTIERL